ncbi:MAG: hypothetical protein ACR2NG_02580 [Acidimicrobiia bacterium]
MAIDPVKQPPAARLRTPRSAAAAGIVFAVLLGVSMVIVQSTIPAGDRQDPSWLSGETWSLSVAVTLVPFAGIAFLWFMGVVRDQIGDAEDRFFATVFLGSGLLMLASLFVWIGLIGAALATTSASPDWPNSDTFPFVASLIDIMGSTIALRMAGVFVFATSTIWMRTGVMPKWVGLASAATGVALLIGGGQIRHLRFLFPLWVLFVSILILVAVRKRRDSAGADA